MRVWWLPYNVYTPEYAKDRCSFVSLNCNYLTLFVVISSHLLLWSAAASAVRIPFLLLVSTRMADAIKVFLYRLCKVATMDCIHLKLRTCFFLWFYSKNNYATKIWYRSYPWCSYSLSSSNYEEPPNLLCEWNQWSVDINNGTILQG